MVRRGQAARSVTLSRWLCLILSVATPALRAEAASLRADPDFTSAAVALEPVNFVMAQADIGTAARRGMEKPPHAAEQQAAAVAKAQGNSLMRLIFQDSAEERGLQLAPIRWRANVGIEHRLSRSEDSRRTQTLEISNMEVSTFIGAPWIAQVRGNLGFIAQQQRENGDPAIRGIGANDDSVSIMGGATLAVFPSSRFPFTASFETTDSRASGEATSADYRNHMLALRQSYRSPLGDQVYGGSLERSTLISDSFGRDSVTALTGMMQRRFGVQSLDVNGGFSRNRRSGDGLGSDVARLAARHSYRHSDLASVESFGAFSMTDLSAPGRSAPTSRFLQLNSYGMWRPEEESPLFVTGGVRFSDANIENEGASSTSRQLGANVAARYALSDEANVVGALNVAHLQGEGTSDFVTNQSVAANYNPAPIKLGPANYSWSTSAAASNQTGGIEGGQHVVGIQANHQISHAIALSRALGLNASVNQGAGLQNDSLAGFSQTLSHTASLGLRISPTPASDGYVSVSLGDSRRFGEREDDFQMANLQASGQVQLGVHSLVTANLTLQAIRQRVFGEEGREVHIQRSGAVTYQHAKLFNVQRLRLVVSATFNDLQLDSRLLGDVAAPRDQFTRLYEGRLQYEIGRLDFRLGTRFATIDGRTDRQFYFRVNRQFGLF